MLPGVESLGSTCALMGKPSTATFLQPEHRNHRSVSPTDGSHVATWRVQIQAVSEAVARSVSPRCAAVPTDVSMSVRSALKATSKVGTDELATRVIEADVLPTSPGHEDACGALGGL